MSLVPTKLTPFQYDQLLGHLDNFFAGVGIMNAQIINDAISLVNKFVASLALPEPTPQPTPEPVGPPPVTEPTDPQIISNLPDAFIETLTRGDLEIGGWRTRATSFGLMKWTGTHRFRFTISTNSLRRHTWKNGWSQQTQVVATSEQGAVNIINQMKTQMGSAKVLEFTPGSTFIFYYLISDGHVPGFK